MVIVINLLDLLRQFKIGPFAIFDTVLAYVGIFLVAPLLTKLFYRFHLNISRTSWLWLTLPIAVIFHIAFGQNTPFTKMFLDLSGFYGAKIILLFMLYMGLRDIRIVK